MISVPEIHKNYFLNLYLCVLQINLFMQICKHTCKNTNICLHMHTDRHTRTQTQINLFMQICKHTDTHAYIYTHECMYTFIHTNICRIHTTLTLRFRFVFTFTTPHQILLVLMKYVYFHHSQHIYSNHIQPHLLESSTAGTYKTGTAQIPLKMSLSTNDTIVKAYTYWSSSWYYH